MWSYYLDTILSINSDTTNLLAMRRRLLGQAYKRADLQGGMNVSHYSTYVNIMYECNASDELVEEILKRAVAKHGDSIEIWTMYMQHYMRLNNEARVKDVFDQSRKRFAKAGAPLWRLYIAYLNTLSLNAAKPVYNEMLKQIAPEFDALKIQYIDWAYTIGGIKLSQQVYSIADALGTMTIGMVEKINELYLSHVSCLDPIEF